MSKITILAFGTRGDVQPFVALGIGLQLAGHDVSIGADPDFEKFISDYKLKFIPIQFDIKKSLRELSQDILLHSTKSSSPKLFFHTFKLMKSIVAKMATDCWEACANSEVIIPHRMALIPTYSMLEKLKQPPIIIPAQVNPMHRTQSFPSLFFPIQKNYGKTFNKITWWYNDIINYFMRKPYDQWRKDYLNLPPFKFSAKEIWLYGISPSILSKPKDWNDTIHMTGFWKLKHSENWQPTSDLDNFLKSGPPPFCINFGSIFNDGEFSNKEKIDEIILESLSRTNQRGILISTGNEARSIQSSNDIFLSNNIPFDWLFPKTAAVINHSGIGTIAAGLMSGIPSICVPIVADQFFWAHRAHSIGASTKPIPFKSLSVDLLSKAINQVVNHSNLQEKALELKKKLEKEDGVATAVEIINNYLEIKRRLF